MSPPATLNKSRHDLPALRRRLARLERKCASLWAEEPERFDDRESLCTRLCEVERGVVSLILKSLADPDDPSLLAETERSEQDLARLAASWSAPRAA